MRIVTEGARLRRAGSGAHNHGGVVISRGFSHTDL